MALDKSEYGVWRELAHRDCKNIWEDRIWRHRFYDKKVKVYMEKQAKLEEYCNVIRKKYEMVKKFLNKYSNYKYTLK